MQVSIDLTQQLMERLDALAARTGRSRTDQLHEILEIGLSDIEDYYLAAEIAARVRAGHEPVSGIDEVERRLGLAD